MIDPVQVMAASGAALFGLSAGSFANVLVYRLPRERSIIYPRSHCFHCGTELSHSDLLPLLGYLRCGGQCRYCGAALSPQYLWVEVACGLLFAAFVWRWEVSLATVAQLVAVVALLAALVTDLKHKIIPTQLNALVFWAGLVASCLASALRTALPPDTASWWIGDGWVPTPGQALAGAVLGYLVFELIVRVGRRVFGQEAMGGGDVLLAAAVGTFLGPGSRFGAFFLIGILSGAVVGVVLIASGRLGRRDPMPFGPYLILGALTVMLFPEVAGWVAHLYGFTPAAGPLP
ncbi:MAG: prepilin peptidase [Fimbriimonadaceae bacterium]|nr:prepilin peptidase [Fimbriimonadaceae bacterium]